MSDQNYVLSILTPNYQDGKALAMRLYELLPLLPADVEYLICDDASKDDSVELITEAIADYPNVRFYQNSENLGVVETFNKITRLAKGKYVYFSSANDYIVPEVFAKMPKFLQQHDFGVLVADILFRSQQVSEKRDLQVLLTNCTEPLYIPPDKVIKFFQTTFLWIPGSSAFLRRDLVIKHGIYSIKIRHLADFYLNHVVAVEAGVLYVPNHLFSHYIVDEGSYTNTSGAKGRFKLGINMLQLIDSLETPVRNRLYQAGIFAPVFKPLVGYLLLKPKHWKLIYYMVKRKVNLSKVRSAHSS